MRPTQVGLKVRELQLQLPKARIVYCSATGASGEWLSRPTVACLPACVPACSLVCMPCVVGAAGGPGLLTPSHLAPRYPPSAPQSRATWGTWSAWGCGGRAAPPSETLGDSWRRCRWVGRGAFSGCCMMVFGMLWQV